MSSKRHSNDDQTETREDIPPQFKDLIRKSFKIVMSDLRQPVCHVAGSPVDISSNEPDKQDHEQKTIPANVVFSTVASAVFIKLFQDSRFPRFFPKFQEFFPEFNGTPINEIQSNECLSGRLQDHADKFLELVEKIIVSMEPNMEKVCIPTK